MSRRGTTSGSTRTHARWVAAIAVAVALVVTTVALLAHGLRNAYPAPSATAYRCPAREPVSPTGSLPISPEPMFRQPVDTMLVCSYSSRLYGQIPHRLIKSVALPHALAAALAQRINLGETPDGSAQSLCLTEPGFSALIARDTSGHLSPMITVLRGCNRIGFRAPTTTRYVAFSAPAVRQILTTLARTAPTPRRP